MASFNFSRKVSTKSELMLDQGRGSHCKVDLDRRPLSADQHSRALELQVKVSQSLEQDMADRAFGSHLLLNDP
jgi:hypothetical protein